MSLIWPTEGDEPFYCFNIFFRRKAFPRNTLEYHLKFLVFLFDPAFSSLLGLSVMASFHSWPRNLGTDDSVVKVA